MDASTQQTQQSTFDGWAIVELMGHQVEVGYVTTVYFGVACLFRIETPPLPEREYTLRRPQGVRDATGSRWAPVGSKVRRAEVPGKSRLVGPPAIYAINPCTEPAALAALEERVNPELMLLEMPAERQPMLAIGPPADADEDEENDAAQDS